MNDYQLSKIDELIKHGQPQFGVFSQVRRVNYLDYHSYLISQKPQPRWQKEIKANQFAFIQIIQPPYRLSLALATIKVATSAFAYLFNDITGQYHVIEALQPCRWQSQFLGDHYQGQMAFFHRKMSLRLAFAPKQVQVELKSDGLAAQVTLLRSTQPLAVCSPSGRRGWTFTQKEPFTAVSGSLVIPPDSNCGQEGVSQTIKITEAALANLDWTLGFMRHKTNWFWSCINTYLPDGRQFLLNLSMGVNESGVSENACWLDGEIYYLPPVMFLRDSDSLDQDRPHTAPWRIIHQDLGWSTVVIELEFTPVTCYKKNDDFIVIASIFEQWLGRYSGVIKLADRTINLDEVWGLAEDHVAKW